MHSEDHERGDVMLGALLLKSSHVVVSTNHLPSDRCAVPVYLCGDTANQNALWYVKLVSSVT